MAVTMLVIEEVCNADMQAGLREYEQREGKSVFTSASITVGTLEMLYRISGENQ